MIPYTFLVRKFHRDNEEPFSLRGLQKKRIARLTNGLQVVSGYLFTIVALQFPVDPIGNPQVLKIPDGDAVGQILLIIQKFLLNSVAPYKILAFCFKYFTFGGLA